MKLIKKIAAIMFAFMMVVSMSCNVKAAGTGKITIDNAKKEETYTIYQVLTLESSDVAKGLYSYTPVNDAWKAYFKTEEGKKYMTVDDNGYVTTKYTETNAQELAQALIKQAKTINYNPQSITPDKDGTIEFTGLALGYYVVDTTVGTLCGLNTANPEITIQDKNKKPTVEKKIVEGEQLVDNNSANIGDAVNFKTTITAQAGAKNYVLHDTMTNSLTFNNDVKVIYNGAELSSQNDYTVSTSNTDYCTFEITFTESFLNTLPANAQIYVTYSATVNKNAVVKVPMTNKTHLTYGDNNTETNKPETTTKTFEMKVFKFYKDKNDSNTEKGLDGAVFTLSKNQNGSDPIKLIDKGSNTYRVAKIDETNTITEVITPDNGRFTIQGLGAGTYYLTETKQPDGYNKLKNPVTVVIDDDGNVTVDGNNADPVKVENKSGTVLPSTGGMGTTMIYLIGGALVLGSGVVLATKRRVKNK